MEMTIVYPLSVPSVMNTIRSMLNYENTLSNPGALTF